ncbi:hypothetical protein CSIV_05130 [Microbacterium sp. CSI-V]|uniref:RecT family recombinase n=1 Tax=Microbacterium sp. CSI-V TaxID=1933777 RepID=UPI00097CA3F2|nr:RecT family recombinase [Microbacterium sp. CSI-V]ONI65663.1 hypothetical protein CSIV_05130 [Microbacterium sp. CSI-V]
MSAAVEVLNPAQAISLPTTADPAGWTADQKALLDFAGLVIRKRNADPVPAPRSTVVAFLQQCERTGLDPIARQIYAIERGGKWTIQVSIDGMRLVAQRSGLYRGQSKAQWTDGTKARTPMRDIDGSIVREGDGSIVWVEDYQWFDVWVGPGHPVAARVTVYRADFDEPLTAVARWDTYKVENDEWQNGSKTGRKTLGAQWEKGGDNMLAKCAEALALRKAFPMDLSGLYVTEEMEHLDIESAPRGSRGSASPTLQPGTRSAQRDPLPEPQEGGESAANEPVTPEVTLYDCVQCGQPGATDPNGGICPSCEDEIEAEAGR